MRLLLGLARARRRSPRPSSACARRPSPRASTFSPMTISAMRGEPRYMLALPSTMTTTSQNAGMYAPPAADGPNSRQICGTMPRQLHLVVEDAPRAAPAREHLDLIGDARAGRVDQVEERHAQPLGGLLDAEDLLDRALAPRAGLHGRVVGHDATVRPSIRADAGDHAVGGQLRSAARWRARRPRRTSPRRAAARCARARRASSPPRSSRGRRARRPCECAPASP